MNAQPPLDFDAPPPQPSPPTIQQRFERFHAENPQVFAAIVRVAREFTARRQRFGVKAIVERLRWDESLRTTPDAEGWKLNNVFVSRYARLLLVEYPGEFDALLETRELKAA